MKSHYELLGLEPTADADAIKKAFRREIARYHPDKVIHLGTEFQEMAATRAAELTVAYKTLTDAALRAEYDDSLASGAPPPHVAPPPPSAPAEDQQPPTLEDLHDEPPPPPPGRVRFAAERADRDQILKRAIAERVLGIVEGLYGKTTSPPVRGFDMVIVPLSRPRFLGAPPPRVLIKTVDTSDAAAIIDVHAAASRANLHAGKSPIVVLLFARAVPSPHELSKAYDALARQRKSPDGPVEIAVVVVDVADWSCRLPPTCSTAVQKLTQQICV